MAIGRIVPWTCWEEWLAVYNGLFAQDGKRKLSALQQVAVWRCRGKVPLGIEVTACLMEILSRQEDSAAALSEGQVLSVSDDVLRLEYSMAIVRMVNGISDKAQKGRTATSVAHNAAAAGLPRLLVDIRHEASHNDLPSLSLLRLAASEALQWLQAAYWQRQQDHLHQQQHHVVSLLQDYIALKTTHLNRQAAPSHSRAEHATPRGSEAGRRVTPIRQAAAGSSAMAMQLTNAVASQEQGAGSPGCKAEEQHAEQAVLNQLKEVPLKPVHASLLLGPLLDHGMLGKQIIQAYIPGPASASRGQSDTAAATAAANCQGILEGLFVQWPALAGLLLAEVIKRLTSKQCSQQQAEVLAGWVQLLTAQPKPPAQQPSKGKSKGTKRKSMDAEQSPATSMQLQGSSLEGPQLRHCIQALLKLLPVAEQKTAAAVQRALAVLLIKLQCIEGPEHWLWGDAARKLADLAQPAREAAKELSQLQQNQDAQPAKADVAGVLDQQQKLIDSCQARNSQPRSALEGWERAEEWTPCAIGAMPSAFDPNGSIPAFQQPQSEAATGIYQQLAQQADAHAVSKQTPCLSRPQEANTSRVSSSELHQELPGLQQMTAQRINALLQESEQGQFPDVWQHVEDGVFSSEASEKAFRSSLLPVGAVVKVL